MKEMLLGEIGRENVGCLTVPGESTQPRREIQVFHLAAIPILASETFEQRLFSGQVEGCTGFINRRDLNE